MPGYDPRAIADAYDAFGDKEWERHETTPFNRVAFHIHRHYLAEFVRSDDRVLEAGSGAGRFTVVLARLGSRVTVIDVSLGQLDLNRLHVTEEGLESSIDERALADIVDLSRFGDAQFDAVVCSADHSAM